MFNKNILLKYWCINSDNLVRIQADQLETIIQIWFLIVIPIHEKTHFCQTKIKVLIDLQNNQLHFFKTNYQLKKKETDGKHKGMLRGNTLVYQTKKSLKSFNMNVQMKTKNEKTCKVNF